MGVIEVANGDHETQFETFCVSCLARASTSLESIDFTLTNFQSASCKQSKEQVAIECIINNVRI